MKNKSSVTATAVCEASRPRRKGQSGSGLVYIIILISIVSALTAGVLSLSTSQRQTELTHNNRNRAVYLAEAGLNFVHMQLAAGIAPSTMVGNTYDLGSDRGKFRIESITGDIDSGYVVGVLGIANEGESWEANYRISGPPMLVVSGEVEDDGPDISFDQDMEYFDSPVSSSPGAFVSNVPNQELSIGGSIYNSFGALWYRGDKFNENTGDPESIGGCDGGACNFYRGFRLFYTIDMTASSQADGWTFTIMNAANNDTGTTGGWSPLGELMGYSGDSYDESARRCVDEHVMDNGTLRSCWGIVPPKFALEYDTWYNGCDRMCRSASWNSRCDRLETTSSTGEDQVQFMYWGEDSVNDIQRYWYSSCLHGRHESCDDNRHNRGGSGDNPRNIGDSQWDYREHLIGRSDLEPGLQSHFGSGYTNWINEGVWAVRQEVVRADNPDPVTGSYTITLRAWMRYCGTHSGGTWTDDPGGGCDSVLDTAYENTRQGYNPSNHSIGVKDYTLEETFVLTASQWNDMQKFYFGWTESTGGATQDAYIREFQLSFIRDYYLGLDQYCSLNGNAKGCTVDVDPDWPDDM
ncbi:MAG: hypothetical protein D6E12_18910 [Desulfovibrio sp.]|nr:MAG: hypothetical protein D6E12_18910 [Desulfovibrio sp.]